LQTYVRGAEQLGIRDLVLPIVYVDIPGLQDDAPVDDAIALVKTFQWVDWRQLRFANRSSSEYRSTVAGLAQRLVDANRQILSKELETDARGTGGEPPKGSSENDEPGIIDLIAAGEAALPEWVETINAIGREIEGLNTIVTEAVADLGRSDQADKGAAGRLAVAKKLAQDLTGPADQVLELANKYASQAYDVDAAVRTLISAAPGEIERDPEQTAIVCEFFGAIRMMTRNSRESIEGFKQMVNALSGGESISRDLRPPIQKLKKGITILIEATAVTDEWARAINESPIDCGD
jgi:hypothetical protein